MITFPLNDFLTFVHFDTGESLNTVSAERRVKALVVMFELLSVPKPKTQTKYGVSDSKSGRRYALETAGKGLVHLIWSS
jgi:hypothetical protein